MIRGRGIWSRLSSRYYSHYCNNQNTTHFINNMELKEEAWGQYDGLDCKLFTITDKSGFLASFTDLGAASVRVVVNDRDGKPGEVAVTQYTPDILIKFGAYLGATVGRIANRIGGGKFSLEGKDYTVAVNNGPNHLHGGLKAYDKKIWTLAEKSVKESEVKLKFTLESPDGDEGYPGKLSVSTLYTIQPNKLTWEFQATTDATTIVNITNHNYWNLDAIGVAIDPQVVKIAATTYNTVDEHGLNTGEIKKVSENMATDSPITFAEVFVKYGDVDNNFFIDAAKPYTKNQRELHECAEVYSPKTGRVMTIRTTEPCVQLYTANFLGVDEIKTTNGGLPAKPHYAFCLETQRPSNAIHQPEFRDLIILKPGEVYYHKTEHEFKLR